MADPHTDNIVVAVRVRPLDPAEALIGAKCIVRCQGQNAIISDPVYHSNEKVFRFDYAFWSGENTPDVEYASQVYVYNHVGKIMLNHSFEGFNTCILSYGQTNAGKTYTMMGPDDNPGIIPRSCEELFYRINEHTSAEIGFKVELSYFEIYNERVRCLLNPNPANKKDLRVREHPVTGPYVEGLTRLVVNDYGDIRKWLMVGNQARTVAATKYNQHSSRSHSVVALILTQTKIDEEGRCTDLVSKINLVDLAGSERCGQSGASSDLFKEGVTINKSLSTLGRVIHALSELKDEGSGVQGSDVGKNRRHWVAYRDSVLTWLLKENLGGNSKTIMLANLSPASTNYEESLCTLRYADRVKYIRNEAVINEDQNDKLIRELKEEINYLRLQLYPSNNAITSPVRRSSYSTPFKIDRPPSRSGDSSSDLQETISETMREWKSKLEMSDQIIAEINQSWQERLRHSQNVLKDKIQQLEREILAKTNACGFAVGDLPLLININPHPVPGEQLAHVLKPGETYLGTDDDPITEETKDDIRLPDGFNLSNPHCIFEHHETGEVEIIPLNGSLSYVNGQLLTTTYILTHGCRVVLGSNHVFLFVDPIHSKAFREHRKAQGGGLPRVIDWGFVSREFAESMNILCKPEQVTSLREEIDMLHVENQMVKENYEILNKQFETFKYNPFLVLLVDTNDPKNAQIKRRLAYSLSNGKNSIGFSGDISPPGVKQLIFLDYNSRTGNVCVVMGHRNLSSPLPNGYRIVSGDCCFQLVLPAADKLADLETKPNGGYKGNTNGNEDRNLIQASTFPNPLVPGLYQRPLEQVLEEQAFLDDLKQKLFDFQYAILNMRDQLFPPPPEPSPEDNQDESPGPRPPAKMMTQEEVELSEKRRVLKDDWLLTSKKCGYADILDHMTYLQHELRYLTYVSAQREQLVDQLQYAVEHGQKEEFQAEVEKIKQEMHRVQHAASVMKQQYESQLREKDTLLRQLQGHTTGGMEHSKIREMRQSPADAKIKGRLIREDTSADESSPYGGNSGDVDEDEEERKRKKQARKMMRMAKDLEDAHEKLMRVQAELQISKELGMQQEQELMRLRNIVMNDDRQRDNGGKRPHDDHSDIQSHGSSDVTRLQDEVRAAMRKLQTADAKALTFQQKLECRTQDYDTLYFAHQKLKEDMEAQRQQLHESNNKLRSELEEARTMIRRLKSEDPSSVKSDQGSYLGDSSAGSLPKDSIKAFNKMKDTIKLLTKVAKSKDEKISKLEKEMQTKTELMMSLNMRLSDQDTGLRRGNEFPPPGPTVVSSAPPLPTDLINSNSTDFDISPATLERIQVMRDSMDYTMQQLKAEVIQLSRSSLIQLDKVVSTVAKVGGVDMFKRAYQFIRKVVAEIVGDGPIPDVWPITDRDVEKIKPHHRSNFVKALREMVISYDMILDYIKGGLITYDDLTKNTVILVKMAHFCVVHDRQRAEVSPNRPKSNPSPVQDRESKTRSSSASSNRSTGGQFSSSITRDISPSPGQKVPAYTSAHSRVSSYISPRRATPTTPTTTPGALVRNSSPRPAPYVGYPSTSSPSGHLQLTATAATASSSAKVRTLSPRPGSNTVTPTTTTVKITRPKSSSTSDVHRLIDSPRAVSSPDRGGIRLAYSSDTEHRSAIIHPHNVEPLTGGAMPPSSPPQSDSDVPTRRPPPAPRMMNMPTKPDASPSKGIHEMSLDSRNRLRSPLH